MRKQQREEAVRGASLEEEHPQGLITRLSLILKIDEVIQTQVLTGEGEWRELKKEMQKEERKIIKGAT